ncbi:hypothetical protein [Oceaniglobus indicus]|uniref:hypothetical protein n=1 Tax=Oceaniglobus indicus TaxID=2047749 RepID=UPI0011AB6E9A|nr:hypothetical protein [Oceaniglobus indicus]
MSRVLSLVAMFVIGLPAGADAGAWPRAAGTGFFSVTQELVERDDDTITAYTSFHAEYGLSERLTFGVKGGGTDTGRTYEVLAFARYPVGLAWGDNLFALELGAGVRSKPGGGRETLIQPGFAWGRSFDTRWGPGWIGVETTFGHGMTTKDLWGKSDLTIGLSPDTKSHLILQVQMYDNGVDTIVSLAPSYVRRMKGDLKVELGLVHPLVGNKSTGLKAGTWLEW